MDEVLHLLLVVAAIGSRVQRAHAVRVFAALAQVVLQATGDIDLAYLAGLTGGSCGPIVALRDVETEMQRAAVRKLASEECPPRASGCERPLNTVKSPRSAAKGFR